jgi:5-formyltetrahydrofolate cyclo-ligase
MGALRRGLASAQRAEAGARIAARIAASAEFARAPRVVLYAALADEPPLTALADRAAEAGKLLLWPRVTAAGDVEVAPADARDLVADAAGVLAPPLARAAVSLAPGDLVIAPGVAFGRDGARLGRGGGHYDRLLARAPSCASIGAAFDFQLVPAIPAQPHDRRVDIVATPNEFWRAAK